MGESLKSIRWKGLSVFSRYSRAFGGERKDADIVLISASSDSQGLFLSLLLADAAPLGMRLAWDWGVIGRKSAISSAFDPAGRHARNEIALKQSEQNDDRDHRENCAHEQQIVIILVGAEQRFQKYRKRSVFF